MSQRSGASQGVRALTKSGGAASYLEGADEFGRDADDQPDEPEDDGGANEEEHRGSTPPRLGCCELLSGCEL